MFFLFVAFFLQKLQIKQLISPMLAYTNIKPIASKTFLINLFCFENINYMKIFFNFNRCIESLTELRSLLVGCDLSYLEKKSSNFSFFFSIECPLVFLCFEKLNLKTWSRKKKNMYTNTICCLILWKWKLKTQNQSKSNCQINEFFDSIIKRYRRNTNMNSPCNGNNPHSGNRLKNSMRKLHSA